MIWLIGIVIWSAVLATHTDPGFGGRAFCWFALGANIGGFSVWLETRLRGAHV